MHLVSGLHSGFVQTTEYACEVGVYRSGGGGIQLTFLQACWRLKFDACVCMYSILANRSVSGVKTDEVRNWSCSLHCVPMHAALEAKS